MVGQGDIIRINLNPVSGHEQAGYRPALVISNDTFNKNTNLVIVAPITSNDNGFPHHIFLDEKETKGYVLCEHLRTLDIKSRGYKFIEKISDNKLDEILFVIKNEF